MEDNFFFAKGSYLFVVLSVLQKNGFVTGVPVFLNVSGGETVICLFTSTVTYALPCVVDMDVY